MPKAWIILTLSLLFLLPGTAVSQEGHGPGAWRLRAERIHVDPRLLMAEEARAWTDLGDHTHAGQMRDARKSWIQRHPVAAGAIIGGLVALGLAVYHVQTDDYCRDPDMISCGYIVPAAVGVGAAGGAFIGYVASIPAKQPNH
jgi:hypothetical protein